MLSVTNHLSTDIGGVPFLWILPLSLYLISFIFTFSKYYTEKTGRLFQRLYKYFFLIAVIIFFFISAKRSAALNITIIAAHSLFYFCFACYCRGVSAQTKPAASKLTFFYFMLSVGGALGGAFNQFIAPRLFLSFAEYPVVLLLFMPFVQAKIPSDFAQLKPILRNVLILSAILIVAAVLYLRQVIFTGTVKHTAKQIHTGLVFDKF